MIESDHHPSLHVDFGKFLPKLASYVNYLFAELLLFNALYYTVKVEKQLTRCNRNRARQLRYVTELGFDVYSRFYYLMVTCT